MYSKTLKRSLYIALLGLVATAYISGAQAKAHTIQRALGVLLVTSSLLFGRHKVCIYIFF